MKNDILYNEKSHTKEAANLAELLNLPAYTIDVAGSDAILQTDAQKGLTTAVVMPFFEVNWVDMSWMIDPVSGSYIDDPISGMLKLPIDENVDHALGGIPTSWLKPFFITTAQIDAQENVDNALGLITDDSGKTPAPTDEQGNVDIVPISSTVPIIIFEPEGFTTSVELERVDPSWTIDPVSGLYIDDPISGMINLPIDGSKLISISCSPVSLSQNTDTTTDLPVSMNFASNNSPTAGNDTFTGTASNDRLSGLAGNDTLDGALGNDVLNGGVGADVLMGGICKDKLTGGEGADTFKFASSNESTFWSMDTITDFKHAQGDKMDLSAIDSDSSLVGDQGFKLVNAFSVDATGQLYFDVKTHVLYGSTDADSAPEFAITLSGVNTLLPADFAL